MSYIQQAYKGLYDYWRYLIGIAIIVAGITIFSIPHAIAIAFKTFEGEIDQSRIDDISYLMSLFDSNLNLIFVLLPFAGGLLTLILVTRYLHKQSFVKLTTTRKKIDWKRILFAFFFWGIISSTFVLIDYYSNPESYQFNFKLMPFVILALISIALVPLQTSCEEYLFRGYLMQGIGVIVKNKWIPLIITSAIFGLLHISNPEIDQLGHILLVYYIGTGLFLGITVLMDEGLELALGFHAANNLFTALLVTADWTAFQTHSILKDVSEPEAAGIMDTFFPVFVIFPIVLFIFAKKYKWNNWKGKLFGKVKQPLKENYKIIGES
ncbi:CPBP family intramembrane metalloprotease [Flavobacteriaceae bacterium AU392]|nr:CPBP family intramembrane metalloprotease [Flavobacteriaceae bacterium]RKM85433.1 CPBP family intramembrane metalloprotease [Flavobacteriaceae bacterium AU392]